MNYTRLTLHDRQTIERLLPAGASLSEIARVLGVHRSTVSKEVKRNRSGKFYTAQEAQRLAEGRTKRNLAPARCKRKHQSVCNPAYYFSLSVEEQFSPDLRYGRTHRRNGNRNRKLYYDWTQSFDAEIFRQWYLNRRIRDHVREGRERAPRSLFDWKNYRQTNWAVIRKVLCTALYVRTNFHSHFGIIKGHYRSRGWWSEKGLDKSGKNHPHMRYLVSYCAVSNSGFLVLDLNNEEPAACMSGVGCVWKKAYVFFMTPLYLADSLADIFDQYLASVKFLFEYKLLNFRPNYI